MRVEQKVSLAIVAACAVAIAVALVAAAGTRRLIADATWVGHTHDVRTEFQAVSRHTNAAKADLRDFLLTDDSSFLRKQAGSVAAAESAVATARRLTADNAAQQARLAALRGVLDQRETSFARTVTIARPPTAAPGALVAQLRTGEVLSERIDSIISAADTAETGLLVERMERERNSEMFVAAASMVLIAAVAALALLLWRSIRRDLSGRARAEGALRASEAKFAGILDVAVDAIISIDARGTIVHFNRGACVIFGYDAAEAIGQPLSLLLPARHRAGHPDHVAAFASGEATARRMGERRQIHGRRKNGEEFDAEASISKLATADGMLFTAVLRDVTERKRLEGNEHAIATASRDLAMSLDYETTLRTVTSLPVPLVGSWSILDIAEEREHGEPVLRRLVSRHPDPEVDGILRAIEKFTPDWDSPEPLIDVFRTGAARSFGNMSRDWLEAHLPDGRQVELVGRLGMRGLMAVPLI